MENTLSRVGVLLVSSLFQDPQPRVDNVPVQIGPHNVPRVVLSVVVAGPAVEEPDVVEGQHVARARFESVGLRPSQLHELGVRLVPGLHLLKRHVEVAVPLGHAVVHSRVPPLGVAATRIQGMRFIFPTLL